MEILTHRFTHLIYCNSYKKKKYSYFSFKFFMPRWVNSQKFWFWRFSKFLTRLHFFFLSSDFNFFNFFFLLSFLFYVLISIWTNLSFPRPFQAISATFLTFSNHRREFSGWMHSNIGIFSFSRPVKFLGGCYTSFPFSRFFRNFIHSLWITRL